MGTLHARVCYEGMCCSFYSQPFVYEGFYVWVCSLPRFAASQSVQRHVKGHYFRRVAADVLVPWKMELIQLNYVETIRRRLNIFILCIDEPRLCAARCAGRKNAWLVSAPVGLSGMISCRGKPRPQNSTCLGSVRVSQENGKCKIWLRRTMQVRLESKGESFGKLYEHERLPPSFEKPWHINEHA